MEDISQKSVATVHHEVNQLKLPDSEHHLDGCFWLLNLLQVIALIRGQMRQLLHSLILFVQIVVLRNVMLVQTVNVDTDDNQILKSIPNDVLSLVIPKKHEVMRLEQSMTGKIGFHLTILVDSLKIASRDVHGHH